MTGPLRPIHEEVRRRLEALKAGEVLTGSVVPDDVHAAILAGQVAQVVIFCDNCGIEHRGDYIGETREDRFAAAREYLARVEEWDTGPYYDLCPSCAKEEQ